MARKTPSYTPSNLLMFRNLRCAYTNEPVDVRKVVSSDGTERFFAPFAYDPAAFQASTVELFDNLSWRNGVQGAAQEGAALVCPYTGRTMKLQLLQEFGARALGGFSPQTPVEDPAELARGLLMRNGVLPENAPELGVPPKIKASPNEEVEIHSDEVSESVREMAEEQAEKLVHSVSPKKISIQVAKIDGEKKPTPRRRRSSRSRK